jgi:hypothetical protein
MHQCPGPMCPYEHPDVDDSECRHMGKRGLDCDCDLPAPLVAGAIGRGVADAAGGGIWASYGRYQVRLEQPRGGPTVQG